MVTSTALIDDCFLSLKKVSRERGLEGRGDLYFVSHCPHPLACPPWHPVAGPCGSGRLHSSLVGFMREEGGALSSSLSTIEDWHKGGAGDEWDREPLQRQTTLGGDKGMVEETQGKGTLTCHGRG